MIVSKPTWLLGITGPPCDGAKVVAMLKVCTSPRGKSLISKVRSPYKDDSEFREIGGNTCGRGKDLGKTP